jgi:hypothetical protein
MKINVGYCINIICCPTTKVPLKAKTSRLYLKFGGSDFGKKFYESIHLTIIKFPTHGHYKEGNPIMKEI